MEERSDREAGGSGVRTVRKIRRRRQQDGRSKEVRSISVEPDRVELGFVLSEQSPREERENRHGGSVRKNGAAGRVALFADRFQETAYCQCLNE